MRIAPRLFRITAKWQTQPGAKSNLVTMALLTRPLRHMARWAYSAGQAVFFRTVGSFGVFLVFWATHVPPSSRYSFDLYHIALYLKHICIWTSFCTLTSCGEEISIASDCALEEKVNVEGFTEYGCYDHQPKTLEVLFDSIDANNSCSFTTRFDFLISCRFVSLYAIN